jgi:hypothetical protein
MDKFVIGLRLLVTEQPTSLHGLNSALSGVNIVMLRSRVIEHLGTISTPFIATLFQTAWRLNENIIHTSMVSVFCD